MTKIDESKIRTKYVRSIDATKLKFVTDGEPEIKRWPGEKSVYKAFAVSPRGVYYRVYWDNETEGVIEVRRVIKGKEEIEEVIKNGKK